MDTAKLIDEYAELVKETVLIGVGLVLGFIAALCLVKWDQETQTKSPSTPSASPRTHVHLNRTPSSASSAISRQTSVSQSKNQ